MDAVLKASDYLHAVLLDKDGENLEEIIKFVQSFTPIRNHATIQQTQWGDLVWLDDDNITIKFAKAGRNLIAWNPVSNTLDIT